jgi:hypothetical protein
MKIQLVKASGDMQPIDLPKDVKTIEQVRKHLELEKDTRVIEGGKELKNKDKVKKDMKLVVIPKEEQGC